MRIPRPLGIGIVIALVAGVYFVSRMSRGSDTDNASAPQLRDPGYAARDAEVIETGEDGRERYRLNAEHIRQQSETGEIELERLAMNYQPTQDATGSGKPASAASPDALRAWRVTADRGTVQANGDQVRLDGQVHVVGPAPGSGLPIEFTTDLLFMSLNAEVIRTESPVTVKFSGHRVTAVGMQADLKARTLRLESDVHGKISR
jgi:lipopolysaccharide export system protein LptC